eukprot:m.702997 g.702997  ORF g.702997 m.702997 type:complete len:481 (-) comp58714_c0_seq7:1390-2832(-)
MMWVLLVLCAGAAVAQYPSCFANGAHRASVREAAVLHLAAAGYSVTQDSYISFENFCHEDSVTCYGQNPSSPYGRFMLKAADFTDLHEPIWQLRADEALIFYGCTPPESRYFGFQPYAMVSGGKIVFADMTDSINYKTVNTSQPKYPFDTEVLFITSGDQQADTDTRSAFSEAGVAESNMNSNAIPNVADLGLDAMGVGLNNTIFANLFRITDCANSSFCNAYFNSNWTVLRATPIKQRQGVPFPVRAYVNRTVANDESDLNSTLTSLVSDVIKAFESSSVQLAEQARLLPLFIDGRTCIREKLNCVGDTRDACYMDGNEPLLNLIRTSRLLKEHDVDIDASVSISPNGPQFFLSNDTEDFILMVGIIHNQTPAPMASYTNIVVYDVLKQMGVAAFMDDVITGSAQQYGVYTNAFYAFKFARTCGHSEQYCYAVPTTFPGVPLDYPLTFVERAYVNPATNVGPDPAQLLPPVILHFKKRF